MDSHAFVARGGICAPLSDGYLDSLPEPVPGLAADVLEAYVGPLDLKRPIVFDAPSMR